MNKDEKKRFDGIKESLELIAVLRRDLIRHFNHDRESVDRFIAEQGNDSMGRIVNTSDLEVEMLKMRHVLDGLSKLRQMDDVKGGKE